MAGIHAYAEGMQTREELLAKIKTLFGEPKNATRLVQDGHIWVDAKRGLVIVDGYVTLRRGQLEMFACPAGTKEHESIVAVFAAARHVHAGLLAAGAESGGPTQFDPYRPASGTTIKVSVLYHDESGKRHIDRAQSWIRDLQSKKEMPFDWVFAGSTFYKDIDTGEPRYLGDAGDLICVANFPAATLDLAVESAAANSGLNFEAMTENIPPMYTPVRLVLRVSNEEPKRSSDGNTAKSVAGDAGQPSSSVPVDNANKPKEVDNVSEITLSKPKSLSESAVSVKPALPEKSKNSAVTDGTTFNVDELFEKPKK